MGTHVAARAFYLIADGDAARAAAFAKRVYRAYFAQGRDITEPALVLELAAAAGADAAALAGPLGGEAVKERVKSEVAAAMKAGVFGSPFFVVDGEPFWGVDKMPMLEDWVRTGGW